MILSVSQLSGLFQWSKISSNKKNLQVKCPKCGKSECYVSLIEDNHPGRCWREKHCGYTFNIYTLLRLLGRIDEFVSEYRSYKEEIISELKKIDSSEDFKFEELQEIKLPIGFRNIQKDTYLDGRGFSKDDYEITMPGKTKISSKFKDAIIFPVFEDFRIVGYISRSIHSKEFCKENIILRYQKSETNFENVVYGLHNYIDSKTAILVEGIFDFVNVNKCVRDNSLNYFCFPLLGVFISRVQINKLKKRGFENLVFLLDKDIESKLREYSKSLIYDFNCYIAFCDEKDPGDSSQEEIFNAINNAKELNSYLINNVKSNLKYE